MAINVLLVDDSATIRAILEKTLRIAEVPVNECHHASNGKEALEVIDKQWIDLIFADINMPVMNGVEMIDRLAEDGMMKSIAVVVTPTDTTRIAAASRGLLPR